MKIYKEFYGKNYELEQILTKETWAGAKDRINEMSREELNELIEYLLINFDEEPISMTQLNDFIWFEWEEIKEEL